jgi:hypothetical protein
MHEQVVSVMSEFCRWIGRSGTYALLAMAFVLGCSLLVAAEGPETSAARGSDPTQPSSLTGSTDRHLPEESAGAEAGAGQ